MKRKLCFLLAIMFANLSGWSLTRITPINSAEAIFAPFWDTSHEEHKNWQITKGSCKPNWTGLIIQWQKKDLEAGKPVFEFIREDEFSCASYDQLMLSGMAPEGCKLRVTIDTDQGTCALEWISKRSVRDEYILPLQGASIIKKITIGIFATERNQVCNGSILWLGLQDSIRLKQMLGRQKEFMTQPLDVFLAPKGTIPSFTGGVNLLAPAETLKAVQEKYQIDKAKAGHELLGEKELEEYAPETLFSDSLPFSNLYLFGRVRDENRNFKKIRGLISKGLISKNQEMLEKAVRTAIVFALTPNWDSSFLSAFPGSGWDQRVFSNAFVVEEVALVLDYCDELLSTAGRNLLLKRLSLEGLGQINYNIWRYSYLFGNNQLSVFTRGRVAAYLVLEKTRYWNGLRVQPYTELAMSELYDSIQKLIFADGSFMEGPPYFGYTLSSIQPVLEMYSSARGKKLQEILPASLKNLGNFADVFISTDRQGGMIPVSSGQGMGRHMSIALYQFLAQVAPESQWQTLYHERLKRQEQEGQVWYADVFFMARQSAMQPVSITPKPLATLPSMGVLASTRFIDEAAVKILLVGTKANTRCHRHNDRGSFVLEFAGDTYAADPGGQNYADADAGNVKRSDYHNMLVSSNMPENEETFVATADIYPQGTADQVKFHAEILPAPSSYDYFSEWKRVFDSPSPEYLTITDNYEMAKGHTAAKFLWITTLPWKKVSDTTIRLDGKNSYALIHFPKEMKFQSEILVVRHKDQYTRLSFENRAATGEIKVQVELHLNKLKADGDTQ